MSSDCTAVVYNNWQQGSLHELADPYSLIPYTYPTTAVTSSSSSSTDAFASAIRDVQEYSTRLVARAFGA